MIINLQFKYVNIQKSEILKQKISWPLSNCMFEQI